MRMEFTIREYQTTDVPEMTEIWNTVVAAGDAFPQIDPLDADEAEKFFAIQSFTAVAQTGNGGICGLYILHPNNVGRCGHIANASYAVKVVDRGKSVGRHLVEHSLKKGKELGFGILQFNAVVRTNTAAIRLYEQLGFNMLGTIPGGFLTKENRYEDIVLFYHPL